MSQPRKHEIVVTPEELEQMMKGPQPEWMLTEEEINEARLAAWAAIIVEHEGQLKMTTPDPDRVRDAFVCLAQTRKLVESLSGHDSHGYYQKTFGQAEWGQLRRAVGL